MINPSGNGQIPNNILQSNVQQTSVQPQNAPDKRAEQNKPQQNRTAESAPTQNSNQSEKRDFKQIAESILANRQESGNSMKPAIDRGSILDVVV